MHLLSGLRQFEIGLRHLPSSSLPKCFPAAARDSLAWLGAPEIPESVWA